MNPVSPHPHEIAAGRRVGRWLFTCTLLAWMIAPFPTRADNIDENLLKEGRKLFQTLKERNWNNVGVLKFRVKKGDRDATFEAGLLNANMATRLEYALVLENSNDNPIGITRDASRVAAGLLKVDKKSSYLDADYRQKLFGLNYPLAWGKNAVKVDAFLTGMVVLGRDFRKTTVLIEAFDVKNNKIEELLRFTVETDRSILADSGESFSLVKRGDDADANDVAIEDVSARNEGKVKAASTSVDSLVGLEIYYNDQLQQLIADPGTGEKRVPEPKEGAKVHFVLRNKSAEKLAVVLRVNGLNTLNKEGPERQIDRCTRWILAPRKEYAIRGFYLPDNSIEAFKVASPAGLVALDPQKIGLIELAVFRESEVGDLLATKQQTNLRGLALGDSRPATVTDLQKMIRKSWGPAATKGLIMPGEVRPGQVIETDEVKNPIFAGLMTIRYYP
jgi:hypothetical protein